MRCGRQSEQLSSMQHEVRVLTRALELHADELGLEDRDIKHGLLYELGRQREEGYQLSQELALGARKAMDASDAAM